ncbi:hypothetical protein V7167_19740 [Bacillus toyonensis]|uniref:hypothetical protein n=1 Tax=Bacillus toyonensis TaxID=155322 RepID=UPI000BF7C54B|nr:hypothetical protein [Bacillus toyonensis]PGE32252.1 hypothetical protein COM60_31280 [Bacillus toyonensis]PHD00303.1 hypothetical protein COF44_13875 [Bacillus toyonensis]
MFKKLVVGTLVTGIALTGGIASASTEGVDNNKNSAPIIQRIQILKDDFSLINGEREVSFEHVKKADMRVHMTNNTKGTLDWSLKDSKGNVIGEGSLAAGKGFTNTYNTLSKGKYKLKVTHRNGGSGSFYAAARTLD